MVLTRDISEMNAGDHHRCCWRKRSLYSAPLPGRLTHWLKLCKALQRRFIDYLLCDVRALVLGSCVSLTGAVLKSTLARTPARACDGAVSPLDGAAAPEQEAVALKPEPPQAPAPPHRPLLQAKRALPEQAESETRMLVGPSVCSSAAHLAPLSATSAPSARSEAGDLRPVDRQIRQAARRGQTQLGSSRR